MGAVTLSLFDKREIASYHTTDLENRRTSVALRRKTLLDQRGAVIGGLASNGC